MQTSEAKLVDCGVDWLTVTTDDRHNGMRLASRATALFRKELLAGFWKKPWGMAGYTGFCAGSVQLGEREGSCLVRVGGHVARDNWRELYQFSDNCSRLDLQVTVVTGVPPTTTIHKHYKHAKKARVGNAGAPALSLFSSSDGSCTLYLGKRVSDRFGRIYDKGSESGLECWRGALRYEVEFKGDIARREAARLFSCSSQDPEIISRVSTYFVDRHCPPALVTLVSASSRWPTRVSDIRKSLAWMKDCCGPTVRKLMASGMDQELLSSLGIAIENGRLTVLEARDDREEKLRREI